MGNEDQDRYAAIGGKWGKPWQWIVLLAAVAGFICVLCLAPTYTREAGIFLFIVAMFVGTHRTGAGPRVTIFGWIISKFRKAK